MKKRIQIIIILLLVTYGAYLRLENLSQQSYWMDEGFTINAVISTMEKGTPILDSGERYKCELYCYPTALFVKTLGNTPSSYRLLSAIFGVLSLIALFIISKKTTNTHIALLVLFFSTFSYWQIAWSRQARWYSMFLFFFWLAIYFFYRFIFLEKKYINITRLSLFLLFTLLTVLAHQLGILLLPIYISWFIFLYFKENKNIFSTRKMTYFLLSVIILLLSIETYFNFTLLLNIVSKIKLSYTLPYYLSFYLRNYWLFIFFGLLAILDLKHKKYANFLKLLSFTFIIYLISLSFFSNIVHYRYLFHLTPYFYLIGSIGIIETSQKIKKTYLKLSFFVIIITVFFVGNQGILSPRNFYFLESDNPKKLNRPYYAYTPQPNFNKAYLEVSKLITKDDIIISSHPQFNKIFLSKSGYWIKHNYRGNDNYKIKNDQEHYVSASVIDNVDELKEIINNNTGYLVLDFMSTDNRINTEILNYINLNLELIFFDEINPFSKIWVYKF